MEREPGFPLHFIPPFRNAQKLERCNIQCIFSLGFG